MLDRHLVGGLAAQLLEQFHALGHTCHTGWVALRFQAAAGVHRQRAAALSFCGAQSYTPDGPATIGASRAWSMSISNRKRALGFETAEARPGTTVETTVLLLPAEATRDKRHDQLPRSQTVRSEGVLGLSEDAVARAVAVAESLGPLRVLVNCDRCPGHLVGDRRGRLHIGDHATQRLPTASPSQRTRPPGRFLRGIGHATSADNPTASEQKLARAQPHSDEREAWRLAVRRSVILFTRCSFEKRGCDPVARPKEALISRRRSLEAALAIIDSEGLAALSIRKLADVLGVNGASLYHHFASKDAIVSGAAQLALADVRTPNEPSESWREWLPRNAYTLRSALLEHPELIPVIVRRRSLGFGAKELDASARRLMSEGVPSAAVMPLIDALELMAIGSALHESQATGVDDELDDAFDHDAYPSLTMAIDHRGLGADEVFEVVVSSIVDSIERACEERRARWLPPNLPDEA
jgi:AcrR family transcriptional regulator